VSGAIRAGRLRGDRANIDTNRTLGPAIGTMVFSQTSLDLAGPAPSPEGMTVQSSSILIRELRARSGGLLLSSHRNIGPVPRVSRASQYAVS
jgi:hypothetical protein